MESTILIAMLIVTCAIIAICIGEISTTAKENKQLKSDLFTVERDKETIEGRLKYEIGMIRERLEDEKRKRQEAERKLKVAEDCQIQATRVTNPIAERKRLAYKQAIRRREFRDNPEELQREEIAVKEMLVKAVMGEVSKHIKEYDDAMHCETVYSIDVWV